MLNEKKRGEKVREQGVKAEAERLSGLEAYGHDNETEKIMTTSGSNGERGSERGRDTTMIESIQRNRARESESESESESQSESQSESESESEREVRARARASEGGRERDND